MQPEKIDASWLRRRCRSIHSAEEEGAVLQTAAGDQPAAVLLPVIDRPRELTMLFTLRTAHLRDHAGQVSFPGGRAEEDDATPVATALREAEEEVGLRPEHVEVLATLSPYRTATGFLVTPVLGLVAPPLALRLDDFEVAEVFEAPLSHLLDARNYREEEIEYRGARRRSWDIAWNGYRIWGATAGILVALRRFLLER